jgi:hypothetical protein
MSKLRTPVIFEICGTDFEVDIDKRVLRQTDNRANEIIIADINDLGNYYWLAYDLKTKNAYYGSGFPDHVKSIMIPPLIKLDPEGMAVKYSKTPHDLKNKTDFDIIVDQKALASRKQNILPRIDIAGEQFIVDLLLHELRHAQHFFPVISLKSFELTNDGWHYEAFYEPLMKQVVEIDPKLLEFPQGIIKIKIPNEIGLDPVAAAQIYGMVNGNYYADTRSRKN